MNDSPEPRRMTSLDRKIEAAGRRAREEAAQHARGEPVMGDITGIGQGDVPMIRRDMTPRDASMMDRDEPERTVGAIVTEVLFKDGEPIEAAGRAEFEGTVGDRLAWLESGAALRSSAAFGELAELNRVIARREWEMRHENVDLLPTMQCHYQTVMRRLGDGTRTAMRIDAARHGPRQSAHHPTPEQIKAAIADRERSEAQLRATWEASPEKRITEAVKPEFAAMPGDAIAKIQFGRNIMRAMHPHKQEAADIQSSQARARNASMLGDSDMAKRFAEHNLGRGFRLEDRAAGNPCKAGDIISVPPGAFVTGRRVERFTVPMSSAKMGEPMVYRGGCTVRLAVLEGGEVEVMVEYPATE